jgi:hypothetical protein
MIKDDSMMPTSTYQGCDCETCKELNVDCPDCPVCSKEEETDSEVAMAMYDSSIGKSLFTSIREDAKDYSKDTRITSLFKD